MKYLMLILTVLLTLSIAKADESPVLKLAKANGFNPPERTIKAIELAAERYGVDPLELAAIGILETGLGKYKSTKPNKNGTVDLGVFQINTINKPTCIEYNLFSVEGSAYCAAKLLSNIKADHGNDPNVLGRYHSGTPELKRKYAAKITKVLGADAE